MTSSFIYCNVLLESDSLHEDRRAGILPDIEAEEESMKNNPPSNGTVDSCQVSLPQTNCAVLDGGLVLSCEKILQRTNNISGTLTPLITIQYFPPCIRCYTPVYSVPYSILSITHPTCVR